VARRVEASLTKVTGKQGASFVRRGKARLCQGRAIEKGRGAAASCLEREAQTNSENKKGTILHDNCGKRKRIEESGRKENAGMPGCWRRSEGQEDSQSEST